MIPVILPAVRDRVQGVADDSIGLFDFGVGVRVVCRTHYYAGPNILNKGLEHFTSELGVVIYYDYVWQAVSRA
jgi:hypothetical protein